MVRPHRKNLRSAAGALLDADFVFVLHRGQAGACGGVGAGGGEGEGGGEGVVRRRRRGGGAMLVGGGRRIDRRRRELRRLEGDVDEQIDEGSDDVAVIALLIDPEVTRQQLLQAVPALEAVSLHHLRHRRPEIEVRIVGVHGHDSGAVAVGEGGGARRRLRLLEDGAGLAGIEEEAIGAESSDHGALVGDIVRGGEALAAAAALGGVADAEEGVGGSGEVGGGLVVEIGGVHGFVDVGIGVGAEGEGFGACGAGWPRPGQGGGGGGGGGIGGFEQKGKFTFLAH